MTSNNTTTKRCAACIQNSNKRKVKPSITSCDGCHETYCLCHFIEHRQALNKILDDIAGHRDILRSRIEELPTRILNENLKMIDGWENTLLQTVAEAAKHARQQVRQLIISEMERECSELTSKITSFRADDDYFETDIEELRAKIEELNEELNDLPGLNRIELNLPTLDCSNMIHITSFEAHSSSEIAKSNDFIMLKPKEEYRSFINRFLKAHKSSIDLTTQICGYICASPTMLIDITGRQVKKLVFYRQSTSSFDWKYKSVLAYDGLPVSNSLSF